ncbi:MFS transporter [Chitinibacter bivalviorum]|uniref:MFS transporter n=1 Tax=Chitinibacter bivalviorum TaxID=2739434 RepID=A0A7H9BK96_9NEIS|nr:MFS transporter [Chitinibacter bivalviorum]QLG89105.1 MFS transporter [Chitinibacter bivalviorum]
MNTATITSQPERASTRYRVLAAISSAHFLNDMMQSLILALYPMLKGNYHLSFAQLGLITLTYQITASILQPLIGAVTDKRPQQHSLVVGMGFTLVGLLQLSQADTFPLILLAAGLVGTGSSIFHPESSRIARFASGGQHGLAQSLFQVGGNAGSATGPLLAALIVIPLGQPSLAWFSLAALLAMGVLWRISRWYSHQQKAQGHKGNAKVAPFTPRKTLWVMGVLLTLLMTKFVYMASFQSYYTFYLIERFALVPQQAQLLLFVFLFAVALGTVLGGPIGDRIGRKTVIWLSILGAAPFSIALPYVGLSGTVALSFIVGLIMSSAFSAMLVYAQELMPGKVGMVSGLFFGLAFGIAGIGAALVGRLADSFGIISIYQVLAFLPLLGIVAGLLPSLRNK